MGRQRQRFAAWSRREACCDRLPKGERQVAGGLKPLFTPLFETAIKDGAYGRRYTSRRLGRIGVQNGGNDVGRRLARERTRAGEELVENRAEREDVSPASTSPARNCSGAM